LTVYVDTWSLSTFGGKVYF